MPYAVRQDFIDRFGAAQLLQLVDRDYDGVEDPGVLDQAIGDASAEIDTYLQGRYQLPLTNVAPTLVRLCCDITRYRLYDDKAPDEVRNRYTDAVKVLNSIANGTLKIGSDELAPLGEDDPEPAQTSIDRVFSRDLLRDY